MTTSATDQPSSSTRLWSSFTRNSVAESTNSSHNENGDRRGSLFESRRRSSLASLPLKLARSRQTMSFTTGTDEPENTSHLGQLFLDLPNEIQAQILCHLEVKEVYQLRQIQALCTVINNNAYEITKATLGRFELYGPSDQADQALLQELYPMPVPCQDVNYLFQMLRRRAMIDRLVGYMVQFAHIKTYMLRDPDISKLRFHQLREKLSQQFYRPAWVTSQFLEKYRRIAIFQHPYHDQSGLVMTECEQCTTDISAIIAKCPKELQVSAFLFFKLLMLHVQDATSAPSYAGTVERRLRGWGKKPPSAFELTQYVVLGGIDTISRISIMKGKYSHRVGMVTQFLIKVNNMTMQNRFAIGNETKPSKSFLSDTGSSHLNEVRGEIETPWDWLTEAVVGSLPIGLEHILFPEWIDGMIEDSLITDSKDLSDAYGYIEKIILDQVRADEEEEEPSSEEPGPSHVTWSNGLHD